MPSATPPPSLILRDLTVPVIMRVNRRAKRMILRADPLRPAVLLTMPPRVSRKEGMRFVEERYHWLAGQFETAPRPLPFSPGMALSLYGDAVQLVHLDGRAAARFGPDRRTIETGGQPEHFNNRIRTFLRREAQTLLQSRLNFYTELLGKDCIRLTIRDSKSRWGSCSSTGAIMLNWRVILAPREVCDYVVAHEAAHLDHLDHSPQFWSKVKAIYGEYRDAARWLKQNGSRLHAYGVEPLSRCADTAPF